MGPSGCMLLSRSPLMGTPPIPEEEELSATRYNSLLDTSVSEYPSPASSPASSINGGPQTTADNRQLSYSRRGNRHAGAPGGKHGVTTTPSTACQTPEGVITDSTMSYVFRATAELHNAGKLSTPDRTLAVRLACSGDTTALTAMATLIASARSFDEQANQLSMYLTGVQQASSMAAQSPWPPPVANGHPLPPGYYRQPSPPGQPYRSMDVQPAYPQPQFNHPQPSTAMANHVPYQNRRRSPSLQSYMPPGGSGSGVISPSSDESGRQPSPGLSPAASPGAPPLYMTGFCGNLSSNDGCVPQLWEPRARRLAPDEYPPLVLEPMRSCSPSPTPPLPSTSPQGTPSPVPYPSPQPSAVSNGFESMGARATTTVAGGAEGDDSENEVASAQGENS
ncbi:hypothetical protein FOZ61_007201 [Perkinsus olseni]|uniref:Uncharacterized protein n=1 Tax=Perkinsus olseni TaxID=32597 RepID=A0A7J6M974_PEROL|nr:hypothetical protein FOZ61_007201 [Perkinsus olseni]